ncbi:hypothetical protein GN244_ATG08474 [Phytophthora infestans]|uniref:Uncharacterized protein n=2 Tax=Phytophthora infestans TaxID=4787 RepID=A0A833TDZ6_PHYIN|nr:hypothetical protein GN244_ATG08474 [Phytophthora infestans]
MPTHNDKKCRRCSCRNKACQRRKVEQRRQAKSLIPHASFLLIPCSRAHRRRQHEMDAGEELQPDEIIVDSEDLQVMRDSVDKMHQQLSRGLRDIQEIRDLVKQAAAQREREQREMDTHKIITEANSTSR